MGPVDEYICDFEAFAGQTAKLLEELLLNYFMAGLREEMSNHVRPHDPQDLMTTMRVALDVEKLCPFKDQRWIDIQELELLGKNDEGGGAS